MNIIKKEAKLVDKILLELLACPKCHSTLGAQEQKLFCATCKKNYPVLQDIPCFVEQ